MRNRTKFNTVMQFALDNGGHFERKDVVNLIAHMYPRDAVYQIGGFLSFYTKNGTFKRTGVGKYCVNRNRYGMDDDGTITFDGIKFFQSSIINFFVSKCGNILSTSKPYPTILRPKPGVIGYIEVTWMVGSKRNRRNVHRIVAETFLPNPGNKPNINHINGVKDDNRLENLEWCTQKENINHAFNTGLSPRGSRCKNAKLTEEKVALIKERLSRGVMQKEIAKEFGVAKSNISRINAGLQWKHV